MHAPHVFSELSIKVHVFSELPINVQVTNRQGGAIEGGAIESGAIESGAIESGAPTESVGAAHTHTHTHTQPALSEGEGPAAVCGGCVEGDGSELSATDRGGGGQVGGGGAEGGAQARRLMKKSRTVEGEEEVGVGAEVVDPEQGHVSVSVSTTARKRRGGRLAHLSF
jgi:hypothetical protein